MINKLEDLDIVKFNRDNKGLLKDCMLKKGGVRRDKYRNGRRVCNPSECPYCGWNPREARRRISVGIHDHGNGLWGF